MGGKSMKNLIYIFIALLVASCATPRLEEAKRAIVVESIRQNNNYSQLKNNGKYLIVGRDALTWRYKTYKSDEYHAVGDTAIWYHK